MADKEWIKGKGGIFSRVPTRGPWRGQRVYCARVWVRSQRAFRYFTLGAEMKAAGRRLSQIKADPEKAIREREDRAPVLVTFGQVLDAFLAGYRTRGGGDCRRILKGAKDFFGEKPVTDLTIAGLDRYLEHRRSIKREKDGGRKVGESSLRKEVIALGTCLKWAKRRALVLQNPVADYEKPKEPDKRVKTVIAAEQEAALVAKCAPWLADVVLWALYSAMRVGEIVALEWRAIDRGGRVIHVEGGKTGETRCIPLDLSRRLPAILERHPQRIGTGLVFHDEAGGALDEDVLNRRLRASMKAAGIVTARGERWNVLRHTAITRLCSSGRFSSYEVADISGNSPQVIERHYRHVFPVNQDKAAGALDAMPAGAPQTAPGERQTA